jgi:hypothetical protein
MGKSLFKKMQIIFLETVGFLTTEWMEDLSPYYYKYPLSLFSIYALPIQKKRLLEDSYIISGSIL